MLTQNFVRNFHPSLPANARQFNETEQVAFLNTKHNTVCAPYTAATAALINFSKTKINLNYIKIPSSYRAVNTHRLGYTNQSVNVV
jgi:hypothetical protein